MKKWWTRYRHFAPPVLLAVALGGSTATAACIVVIQVQCQPTCTVAATSEPGRVGAVSASPQPAPTAAAASSPGPGGAQWQNYSADGAYAAAPTPAPVGAPVETPKGPMAPSALEDPAANAVLSALTELRRQASCPSPLAVDRALVAMAAAQVDFLERSSASGNAADPRAGASASDRARAAGFTGHMVEVVARGATTTDDLTAALKTGRYSRMALDCGHSAVGVGVGKGIVVLELGSAG